MTSEIHFDGFTVTSLLITAVICLVSVLVAWYTVRTRVRFSQIILGLFCYMLVMVLENFTGLGEMPLSPVVYALCVTALVVVIREVVRFLALWFGIRGRFDSADAALGFALGFGGLYLFVCAFYYFSCYTTAREFLRAGMDAFVISAGDGAEEALGLVESLAAMNGWELLATALNRVFFLVRELSLSVLLWYAVAGQEDRRWFALVPLMHFIAVFPDGLYQAELLGGSILRDLLICVLSAGIAFLASRKYNAHEDLMTHYRIERLRTRRRR